MGQQISKFECQLGGRGGGPTELVKSQLFFIYLTLPLVTSDGVPNFNGQLDIMIQLAIHR